MRAITWLMIALMLSGSALAIGVAPAKSVIDFSPGQTIERSFKIVNNQDAEMSAVVYAQGELAETISIPQSVYTLNPRGETTVTYQITMPAQFTEPGEHAAQIVVVEIPKERQVVVVGNQVNVIDGAQVSAVAGVTHDVKVKVPYAGAYVQGMLITTNEGPGEPVIFTVAVANIGTEDLQEVKARVKVFGATYEELAEVRTDTITLAKGSQGRLTASYQGILNPGTYRATAYIDAGPKVITLDGTFTVGQKLVKIKELEVGSFQLGAIGKLDALVENSWNEQLNNVVGEFVIARGTETIATLTSAPVDIPPLKEAFVTGYWDTTGITIGDYDINVRVAYEGTSSERLFPTYVGASAISIKDQLTARASSVNPEGNKYSLLIVLVLVLVVLNVIGIIVFLKMRRRPPTQNTYNVSKEAGP